MTHASWGAVRGAEAIGPLAVKITLEKPFAALVPFLAGSFS
ncbi:hypothetical protein [Chelativorans sp. AA-79]|nr:hypothetical protein [Chelativorans sp. AA-79]WEX09658.1 hypothetical protein PVE73_01410 [Chelativorans sp. AA-79]